MTKVEKLTLVGLTGGIGSGKSTVAQILQDNGVAVINLDRIGHFLIEYDPRVSAKLREICGDGVFDGTKVDRARVRELLFSSDSMKRTIEAFLHPLIWTRFLELAREFQNAGKRFVVCEAALIIESGIEQQMEELIIVIANKDIRKQRLVARDNLSPTLADQMIASQVDDDTRKNRATVLVENNGSLPQLKAQVDELIADWKEKGWL